MSTVNVLASSVIVRKLPISTSIYCVFFLQVTRVLGFIVQLHCSGLTIAILFGVQFSMFNFTTGRLYFLGRTEHTGMAEFADDVFVLFYTSRRALQCMDIKTWTLFVIIVSDSKNLEKAFIAFNKQFHGILYLS